MRRTLLLGLSIIAGAIPSFADIAFYSSQSAWIAAHTGIVSDNFGTNLVPNYNSFTYPTYNSSTGAQVNTLQKSVPLSTGSGSWGAENTSLWGPGFSADLGTGQYLTTYYSPSQSIYGAHITGTEIEDLQDGAWVVDGASTAHVTSYGGGDAQNDDKIVITAPANQTGVAFDLIAIQSLYARGATITVTTTGSQTLTIAPTVGYLQFSFFGFDVGIGDSIASITISSLWAAINDNFGPAWITVGNTRTRTFTGGSYSWGEDDYRLALDNLAFGAYTDGGGGGGDAPEMGSLLLTGAGLSALGLIYKKRR